MLLLFIVPNVIWGEESSLSVPVIQTSPGSIPSDAIVLFDGSGLYEWMKTNGSPAGWNIVDGNLTIVPNAGGIITRRAFGSFQLHLEFATPGSIIGDGQGRGNSGVYLHGSYEIQVLDSYENKTYTDGMVGAVYKQHPPLVNPSRKSGTWQTYDIVFHAPVFDATGNISARPTVTVFLNGVLVQNDVEIFGPTVSAPILNERPRGPIFLQDHTNPVRYRNIWVREF